MLALETSKGMMMMMIMAHLIRYDLFNVSWIRDFILWNIDISLDVSFVINLHSGKEESEQILLS